jgi:PleD family two-component response regulator
MGEGRTLSVTTSCGVAFCRPDDTLSSLTQRADNHLYMAKHAGKNLVSVEPKEGV